MAGNLVYLAHPVDFNDHPVVTQGVVDQFLAECDKYKWTAYCPANAFRVPEEAIPHGAVTKANFKVLDECKALFAVVTGSFSVGVFREIQYAVDHGKRVGVWADRQVLNRAWGLADIPLVRSSVPEICKDLFKPSFELPSLINEMIRGMTP